ncbi:MAG: phage terminase small subunit P27 family [Planctomycetes bacterium]|nr:phage terminase small subunit P27 family [Planctomycetota bacterium]
MGRRGPPKKPVAVHKRNGTFRGDRHSDDVESQLEPRLPDPPEHFDDDQRALWTRIGEQLAKRGLLTELDGMAFELLVSSYMAMHANCRELESQDLVYFTESGAPVVNPLVGVITKNTALLKWCLREFGCTPSARTGIHVAKPDKKAFDPMAALLAAAAAPPKTPAQKRPSKKSKRS